MSIKFGTRIGPYEVTSPLGEGGMGVVFRAHDTKLQRDVALKLLPDDFAGDPDRLSRFQREAQVLASLNHPNIAQIYGLEESDNTRCIVMELVEGETLQERLKRGAIPFDEALPIAKQIAEALEAAHERGIVHRDLKPANIKCTPVGKVKVLDFGLAKAFQQQATTLSNSPTLVGASVPGVILGTAAYMSPEQAKGKDADRSSDVWAFACVLYEMLCGRAAFDGETLGEILGAVFKSEPEWNRLPAATPATIRRLLRRCLQKDRRLRVHDIADAWIEMDEAQRGIERDDVPVQIPAQRPGKFLVGIAAAMLVITIASLSALLFLYFNRSVPPELRVEVNAPATTDPISFAISPDGRRLVFSALTEGTPQLWVRPLDSLAAQPLAGTDGASYPFWSPDSASVGFFADGKLKRVEIVGGAPHVLADAAVGQGGAWNREGTILFAPTAAGPLLKAPAAGGELVAATRLETGQVAHKFPQFLPDGRHFIYFVLGGPSQGIYAGSLDGGSSKRLANADAAAVVSPSGFLFFPRQTTLFAQAFDFKRQVLSGNPFPVAEQVAFDAAINAVGFSATSGIVAYRSGSAASNRQLTWLDRSGKSVGAIGASDNAGLTDVELSPDGKRVASYRTVNGNVDVWLIDVTRGVPTRFTFDAAYDGVPIWAPDGSRVVFMSNRKGIFDLYWKSSSGGGADELLLESDQPKVPTDWSSDGRFLLFRSNDPRTGYDLWVLPVSGDKKPFPFLKGPFEERDGQFSPNGKWIAYQSNESGRFEIYVQTFNKGLGGKFQISSNGGAQPRWNKNSKEIFYVSLDSKMMAAPVKFSPDGQLLETGTPAVLFPVRIARGPLPGVFKQQYAVSSDGQRFLVNLAVDEGAASPITLIYNWKPKAK
jgi:serine/threonine protein kinase/Tol biopolymer transport system component